VYLLYTSCVPELYPFTLLIKFDYFFLKKKNIIKKTPTYSSVTSLHPIMTAYLDGARLK
jgi:hypothetical protein